MTKKAGQSTKLERTEEERRLEIKIERYLRVILQAQMIRSNTIVVQKYPFCTSVTNVRV